MQSKFAKWGIAGIVLLMFGDVFFRHGVILSSIGGDLATQFIYWREFAAERLRHGELPLWNPHSFSGTPFVGWSQTALFYPLNWLDLILPLPLSINLGIVIHFILAGTFMFLWASHRQLKPAAAFVAAVVFILGTPYFFHLFAGHLSLLAAFAWTPLVFLCIDAGWVLLGMFAVTMQILAGDPQAVYYTAIAAGIYSLLQLRFKFIAMYAGAAVLGAIQWMPAWQAAAESNRQHGLDLAHAATFSFSAKNFITMVMPGFFGDLIHSPYRGEWHLWENSFFIGVSALVLVAFARERRLFCVASILVLLALGTQTPLFGWAYHVLPGMDRFRGPGKFLIPASAFLAMLAASGLNRLPRWNGVLAGLVLVELFCFARYWRFTFDFESTRAPALSNFLQKHPGDERFLAWKPNVAMTLGRDDIWGHAPLALKRYAEFIAFSQSVNPDEDVLSKLNFNNFSPMLGLLRCRYFFSEHELAQNTNGLQHVQLVKNYRVLAGRDEILKSLNEREVILETEPNPKPTTDAGLARVIESSANRLTVEVDTSAPTLLLVSDVFSEGWRAPGYTILPADYVLRAVPLTAGHHVVRMQYRPRAFVVGAWISGIAFLIYAQQILSSRRTSR